MLRQLQGHKVVIVCAGEQKRQATRNCQPRQNYHLRLKFGGRFSLNDAPEARALMRRSAPGFFGAELNEISEFLALPHNEVIACRYCAEF
jgi:hypothetical protein